MFLAVYFSQASEHQVATILALDLLEIDDENGRQACLPSWPSDSELAACAQGSVCISSSLG